MSILNKKNITTELKFVYSENNTLSIIENNNIVFVSGFNSLDIKRIRDRLNLKISLELINPSQNSRILLNQKLKRLQEQNITPIFCFGEPIENRENNTYLEFIQNQLNEGLMGIRKDNVNEIIFAYEPIWAIGTGQVATIENIVEVLDFTKKLISSKSFYEEEKLRFIYGGSVSPDNSEEVLNLNIIDGALVGGASLDSDKFVKIINSVKL